MATTVATTINKTTVVTIYTPLTSVNPPPETKPTKDPQDQPRKDLATLISQITSTPNLTPHAKRVYLLTLQIPRGSITTYALLAAHLHSSPRAVGNALRRNPFAPEVPCHRVVASDGSLGGFKGMVARRDGRVADVRLGEKRALLSGEGVRFDARGRVAGVMFCGFG